MRSRPVSAKASTFTPVIGSVAWLLLVLDVEGLADELGLVLLPLLGVPEVLLVDGVVPEGVFFVDEGVVLVLASTTTAPCMKGWIEQW
jgi:hypothetical protein